MENQNINQTTQDFCTKCGNELSPDTKFCVKCGNPRFQSTAQPQYYPPIPVRNKTTRTLNIISTVWFVFTGIALFVAVLAIIVSLTGEPSMEVFLYAIVCAGTSFAQGILFTAIKDIHNIIVNKQV